MKSFFYDLSGGLNTFATKTDLGLNTKRIYWSDAYNVELYKNKGITRQKGNVLVFESPENAPIKSIFAYTIDKKDIFLFSCSNGKIYSRDGSTGEISLVYEGWSGDYPLTYIRFLTGVVISNGHDDPIYFRHNAQDKVKPCNATSSNGLEIRGKALTAYKGRLWAAMGGSLYYSALGRYDDWSTAEDAGYISNFHSDIDEITALMQYKDYLAIYKKDNTFLLCGSSPADFAIEKFADEGALSQSLVVNADNRQYFFNGAIYTLEQVGILSQIALGSEISLVIKNEFEQYNYSSPYKGIALNYEEKGQIWFFCPTLYDIYLNHIYIYDYIHKSWTKRVLPQKITCAALTGGKIYTASADGQVFLEDYGHSFNNEPIRFLWRSPFFALGEPNLRKCVDSFYFLLDDSGDNNFMFNTCKDYDVSALDDEIRIKTDEHQYLVWDSDSHKWCDEDTAGQNDGIVFKDKSKNSADSYWTRIGEGVYKTEITQSNYSVQLVISGQTEQENFSLIGLEFKEIIYD